MSLNIYAIKYVAKYSAKKNEYYSDNTCFFIIFFLSMRMIICLKQKQIKITYLFINHTKNVKFLL